MMRTNGQTGSDILNEHGWYQPLASGHVAQPINFNATLVESDAAFPSKEDRAANTLYYQIQQNNRSVKYAANAYGEQVEGTVDLCDIFLISAPEDEAQCKTSDAKSLYLYVDNENQYFYYVQNGKVRERKDLPENLKNELLQIPGGFLNELKNQPLCPFHGQELLTGKILDEYFQNNQNLLDEVVFTEKEIRQKIARHNNLLTFLTLPDTTLHDMSTFGNGNCGPNSVAVLLIHAIQAGKVQPEYLKSLVTALKDKAVQGTISTYCNKYGVGSELDEFIQFIQSDQLDAQRLHDYLKNNANSQRAIAALTLGLAPALRQIGLQKRQNNGAQKIPGNDFQDAGHASTDLVHAICVELGMQCVFVTAGSNEETALKVNNVRVEHTDLPKPHVVYIAVKGGKTGGHYDPLFPASELNSQFAKNLANHGAALAVPTLDSERLPSPDDAFNPHQEVQRSTQRVQEVLKQKSALASEQIHYMDKGKISIHELAELCKDNASDDQDTSLAKVAQNKEILHFFSKYSHTLREKEESHKHEHTSQP